MKKLYTDIVHFFFSEDEWSFQQWHYHAFFVFFAFLFMGFSIKFQFLSHYINGMDTSQWLNFDVFLKNSLSVWNPNASGKIEPMAFTPFIYNLILKGINVFVKDLILSINIYWIGFIYFLEISFFYFYRIFLNNKNSLIAVLFSFLGIKMITSLQFLVPYVDISLIGIPLSFFLLHSYIFKRKFIYVAAYVVLQILLFRVFSLLVISNILVPLLIFLLFKDKIPDVKDYLKKVILVWVLSFLVCSMLSINFLISYVDLAQNQGISEYNEISLTPFYMNRYNMLNIFKLTDHFSLADIKPEFSGFIFFKFSQLYTQSKFYILVSFIFFWLFITGFLFNRKDKRVIILVSSVLILIFFAKSINPPLEFINQWFYSNTIYTTFFRSGSKYFMYLILPLAVLAIFISSKKFRFFYLFVWISIIAHAFLIFIYARPIAKYWDTTLPYEYVEVTKEIESIPDNDKILLLPISPRTGGELAFKDGYSGLSRMQLLSSKAFIAKNEAVRGSSKYNSMFNSMANGMDVNQDIVDKNADILNYQYILVQKDAAHFYELDINSPVNTSVNIQKNLNKDIWKNIFENNNFALYKINPQFFGGKIRLSSGGNTFFKVTSPVKYQVNVNNLKGEAQLYFMEAFQSGWKLYLEPQKVSDECLKINYFPNTWTAECHSKRIPFSISDIGLIFKKPVFESDHGIYKDYANQWTLNPQYIKKNFSPSFYKENPDGSIDVILTVYFKPQSYFSLAIIISGVTIFICFGYAVYEFFSKRKKLNLNEI